MKIKGFKFKGTVSDAGAKEFVTEIKLIDGSKAYVLKEETYREIYKDSEFDPPCGPG